MAHDALRGSGYIGQARPQDVTPSFEFVLSDLCPLREEKMSTARRPLGSLASQRNVGGEDHLRRRVGPQRTPVQRHTLQMYERREEAWRGLTRQRVAAFLRLFILCFVETENGLPLETLTYRLLKRKLVKGVIPWIYNQLVFTMDERYWPITLQQFRELDQYLADHMPIVQKEDEWGTVAYFFKEMLKQREEYRRLEDMEKEVFAAVQRCLEH